MSGWRWEKLGRVFVPDGTCPWMRTHAALPVARVLGVARVEVVFCGRDERQRSRIGRFELDPEHPGRVRGLSQRPLLDLGSLGAFDDSGVTPSCLVEAGGELFLYYTGWSLGVSVPFTFGIGLARSRDGGTTFERVSRAPVLGRTAVDPYLAASPSVLVEDGRWRMWYVSGVEWRLVEGRPQHWYHVRYAESADGVRWEPTGRVALDFASPDEHAFGRPCVRRDGALYRMWYAVRGARYRIGYAESTDGGTWERRDDEAGIEPSAEGWDAEMIEYPEVFEHAGARYLLYNGNGYGATGIGLARAAADDGP